MYRYYLNKKTRIQYPINSYDNVICRYSPNEEVKIDENVNMPSITIDLDLMKSSFYNTPPHDDEYNTFKRIKKEDFINYLAVTMDALRTFRSNEAEVYFDKPFSSRYEIVFFSTNPKNKYRFNIEVNFDLEWGEVQAWCSTSFSRRRYYQQQTMPIPIELFEYIQIKTYEYLEDDLHYIENFKEYLKLIDLSYQGKINPILPDKTINITPLIIELSNEIRQLETRLLNNDNDSKEVRDKMRGKIEGLKSAVYSINKFFSTIS